MRIIALASAAMLCSVALGSQLVLGEEIQAHETPLKTRLDWTRNALTEEHGKEWDDTFTAQYRWSVWAKVDRLLLAVLTELGPNVAWKVQGDWWTRRDSVEKSIENVAGESSDLVIDFEGRFKCFGTVCVPFTMHGKWSCVFYYVDEFAKGRPKSEGFYRGGENNSTLQGYYCRNNQAVPRTEIDEVIRSFYVDRQ